MEHVDASRNPKKLFFAQVPPGLLKGLLRCLRESYADAADRVADYARPEAHDVLPHVRRATIETALRNVAPRFAGVKAFHEENAAGNCNHTVITFGRFRLTQSAVETPEALVRHAEFRKTYASDNQLLLLPILDDPSPDAPIYGILLHGTSDDPRELRFARIVFPAPDLSGYIEGTSISLLSEHGKEPAVSDTRLATLAKRREAK